MRGSAIPFLIVFFFVNLKNEINVFMSNLSIGKSLPIRRKNDT